MKRIDQNEQSKHSVALQEILALGERQIRDGKIQPAADVIKRLRKRRG
ncbi:MULTISPECIES: hypothetical protein [Pseudomonadati]|jgi:hypothetical protein|nr:MULTISPECIES: hypothetical protein [Bacteria]